MNHGESGDRAELDERDGISAFGQSATTEANIPAMNAPGSMTTLDALRQLANTHMAAGRWPAAQAALQDILQKAPHDLESSIQLADVLFQQGHLRASTAPLLAALRRLPRDAPLIVSLVQHLIARGEIVAARACLDLLAQAPEPPPELLIQQANLRFMIGQVREALAPVEAAVRAGVQSPETAHLHAMLLQFNGQIDRACDVLEECLARWPAHGDAAVTLVNLRKQQPATSQLERWRSQLKRLPEQPQDPVQAFARAEFEYAAFKTLDDLGRPDEAWEALARCNALMHRLNPYSADAEEAVNAALVGMPLQHDPASGVRSIDGPMPIFIVGMPRSGTTLLDRILSSHSQVNSAGEILDFWRQLHWVADVRPNRTDGLRAVIARSEQLDYRELGTRYLRQTQWRAEGRAYYIDKLPANIQLVAFIRRALPQAPILHMVRHPMDTCFSNFKALFGNVSAYSYEMNALAHYFGQYHRLAQHWRDALPGAVLEVEYGHLVQAPEATIREVLAYCRLPPEDTCLHPERNASPVATPSSAQVRQPIHTRGVEQWRTYAGQLEPLRQSLARQGVIEA